MTGPQQQRRRQPWPGTSPGFEPPLQGGARWRKRGKDRREDRLSAGTASRFARDLKQVKGNRSQGCRVEIEVDQPSGSTYLQRWISKPDPPSFDPKLAVSIVHLCVGLVLSSLQTSLRLLHYHSRDLKRASTDCLPRLHLTLKPSVRFQVVTS